MHGLATTKINSYFAILLITIVGSGATLIITHVASETSFDGYGTANQFSPVDTTDAGQ